VLTMLNVIDYGRGVDARRFHQQWLPESTNIERFTVNPDAQKILEGWGRKFSGPQPFNHVAAIHDPRRDS
jgi:gamma-glutamyltranspeptidase/glutathione hydrolase